MFSGNTYVMEMSDTEYARVAMGHVTKGVGEAAEWCASVMWFSVRNEDHGTLYTTLVGLGLLRVYMNTSR